MRRDNGRKPFISGLLRKRVETSSLLESRSRGGRRVLKLGAKPTSSTSEVRAKISLVRKTISFAHKNGVQDTNAISNELKN